MKITVRTNTDQLLTLKVPKNVNGHLCLRALHSLNRGEDFVGLTNAEAEWVADAVAQIDAANEEPEPADERA